MDIVRYSEADLPTVNGRFRVIVYRAAEGAPGAEPVEHLAIVRGQISGRSNVLCRVHSECWTSEVLGSLKCDCREQLERALEKIAAEDAGVVVYLRQEGRGIGLGNKIRAYVDLLTNNPLKMAGLRNAGITVVRRTAHWVAENQYNAAYLAVKRRKMGHHTDDIPRLHAVAGKTRP